MPLIRLLVIDDDTLDRKAVAHALKLLGADYELREARDAATGLAMAIAESFDCILIDYNLPDENGLDLLDKLLAQLNTPVPIVMLTGEGNESVAVEAMKRGVYDYLPKAKLGTESLYRVVANAIGKHLLEKNLAEAREKLETMAMFDTLTGLGNRNLFNIELPRAVAIASRKQHSFSLLLMDLDRFKAVNDRFGHAAGDAVLAAVGERLRKVTRAADACFRIGGDEFTAILDPGSDGAVVAQRIRAAVAEPISFGPEILSVGVSIGLVTYPADSTDPEDLLRVVDAAMYQAKRLVLGLDMPAAAVEAASPEAPAEAAAAAPPP
jgi:diguanylate cyclase (GGDEF)-like protein